MTFRSRLASIFPALAFLVDVSAIVWLIFRPNALSTFLVIFALYGFPLLVFRVTHLFSPICPERATRLDLPVYSPWWGAHEIQLIYEAFPFLEAALRLVPGLYSLWLRLWGSKIGKDVYWPPTVRIIDRSLVEIGDRVVFGHHVECVSHFVTKRKSSPLLFVQKIIIEDDVLVGTHVAMGPGVRVGKGALLGAFSRFGVGVVIAEDARIAPGTVIVANTLAGRERRSSRPPPPPEVPASE